MFFELPVTRPAHILWGDEIFGRHALSSRGWGSQDKRSIEPRCRKVLRPGLTTGFCTAANCPVEVRLLPLQPDTGCIKSVVSHRAIKAKEMLFPFKPHYSFSFIALGGALIKELLIQPFLFYCPFLPMKLFCLFYGTKETHPLRGHQILPQCAAISTGHAGQLEHVL